MLCHRVAADRASPSTRVPEREPIQSRCRDRSPRRPASQAVLLRGRVRSPGRAVVNVHRIGVRERRLLEDPAPAAMVLAPVAPRADGATIEGGAILEAEVIHGLAGFLALEPEWRELQRRVASGNPFSTWEWVCEWARSFWDGSVETVVVRSPAGLVAAAPFHRARPRWAQLRARHQVLMGPRGLRSLMELGTALVDPQAPPVAFQLILERALEDDRLDWIELCAQGDELDRWSQAIATSMYRSVIEEDTLVPVMPLAMDWPQLQARLRRNVKEAVRRSYNAPRRDGLVLSYRECRRHDEGLDEILDAFFRLHRSRSLRPGNPYHRDHFSTPSRRAFLDRVARRMADTGALTLSLVSWADQPVAVRINFEVDGTVYLYYSGFDPAWWSYSVMTFGVTEAIKSAITRRQRAISFSPGVDQSKARWDVSYVRIVRFSVVRPVRASRLRFAVVHTLRRAKHRAIRLVDRR